MQPNFPQPNQNNKQKEQKSNKDLLRLENRIFGLIGDSQVDPKQKAVQKMMIQKRKPQIGMFKQSSLLKQVKNFLPVIQRQNAKLLNQQLPIQKLDVHFQKQSSSQSSDNQQQSNHPRQQKQTMEEEFHPELGSKHIQMNLLLVPQIQKQKEQEQEPKQLKIIQQNYD